MLVKQFFRSVFLGLLVALGLPGLSMANTCAPAASAGTAPADYKTYCWLEFSGYNDTTALGASGQPFSFTLPDGSGLSMTVKTTKVVGTGDPAIKMVSVPSWTGSAFGNTAFLGIPGQTILYSGVNASTVRVTLSGISVTPPAGGTGLAKYAIIVGDGESSNQNESLAFTTNAGNWVELAKIQNGVSTVYPTVAGAGTQTVTETGVSGTVGSYVFGSFDNPTQVTVNMKSGGLQGFIVGVRYASISVVSQIIGQRYSPADQFNYAVKTSAGVTMTSGTTSGTALSGFTPASLPTVAASYPFVVSEAMAGGSTGVLANYGTALTCTNTNSVSSTVLPVNSPGASYTIPSLQYGDAVVCTFTNTPIFSPVTGTVYSDANHNTSQDAGEAGTGVVGLYVKLAPSSGGVCSGPATAAALVNTVSGAYSLSSVPAGSYCLILDNNSTLSDITPALPAGWIGNQNPTGVINLTVANTPPATPQNFGLFNGSRLSGTVFADTGAGAGIANNGLRDGAEAGLSGITVSASAGAVAVASAGTAGDGSYTLWVPASVGGPVTVTPAAPVAYLATGGVAGTTGGSYSRPAVSYTPVAGQSYIGVNFGLVPPNTLAPNGAQSALPGTALFYTHSFQAGSAGQVSFTLASIATPASPTWSQVLYLDSNCNATLDAAEPQIAAAITAVAGQTLCLIVKQFVPADAGLGTQNTLTLSAAFSYTGASPALSATLTAMDVTTVGEQGALNLRKLVSNLTLSQGPATTINAAPGNTLQYTLTALNNGIEPLSTLVISDATPAFTTYLSAACPAVLPASLSACSVSTQPAVGAVGSLQWTFTGSLAPSAQLVVTYQVKVSQ